MRKSIFVIKVMEKLELDKDGYLTFGAERNIGWYRKKKWAFRCVEHNNCDIHEYTYDYAIIEEVEEGTYGFTPCRWFFKYNSENNKYEPIDEPKFIAQYCGLTM